MARSLGAPVIEPQERARENLLKADAGAKFAGDSRCHLQQGWVALDREKVFGADAAVSRRVGEVVAQQIDNHHILAAVFGVVAEPLGKIAVFAGWLYRAVQFLSWAAW